MFFIIAFSEQALSLSLILYEYPLHERIRTWLRLEDLFDKALFFIRAHDQRSHHAALLAIFELIDVMARQELKSELLQELERQRVTLDGLRSHAAVDHARLDEILGRVSTASAELHAMSRKLGQDVRENEWLMGIKSRAGIPGGVCSFDLPSYHYWLNASTEERRHDLLEWLAPSMPVRTSVEVVLTLLREGGNISRQMATAGFFQLMLGGRNAHLLRVGVDSALPCAPEASANKYAVNLRFTVVDKNQRPRTCEQDVPFELTYCSL
jgi:cell division protein ZapD